MTQSGLGILTLPGIQSFAKSDPGLYSSTLLGSPCRNFNILATESIIDPVDNQPKFVLSNFVAGGTGNIIIIDPISGKGESYTLPSGAGAWGLVNWHNKKLVVGTCTGQAYLHVFDLAKRKFSEPVISKGESYFWQMGLASDGKVYGGTYPGCTLTQYDPETSEFKNLGKVSDNPKNQYSRPVFCDAPGWVFVTYGFDTKGVKVYDISKGIFEDFGKSNDTIREVNSRFICLENNGQLSFYDAKTLEPIEDRKSELTNNSIKIQNGQNIGYRRLTPDLVAGVRGQDYFITKHPANAEAPEKPVNISLKRIPIEAPPTSIHTLASDKNGVIWGSCGFGQTIFSFNPATKKYWNSSGVCNNGGEVYGMVFSKEKLFLTAYAGGDHIVYDPKKEWNQLDNVNPKTLTSVSPELIRPTGRSVVGPDGDIWTGWSAKYGTYGGGLSRIDTDTQEVKSWYDPVPHQAVAGLASDNQYLYFTTNGQASGLSYNNNVKCHFVVWKPGEGIVHDIEMQNGETLNQAIAVSGDKVAVGIKNKILIFDPSKLKTVNSVELNTKKNCSWMIQAGQSIIGAFCGNEYHEVNVDKGTTKKLCSLPGSVSMATVTPDGEVFFSVNSKLYILKNSLSGK